MCSFAAILAQANIRLSTVPECHPAFVCLLASFSLNSLRSDKSAFTCILLDELLAVSSNPYAFELNHGLFDSSR